MAYCLAVSDETLGPYALTRRLGQGGMGTLYVGHLASAHPDRELAIKVIDEAYCHNPSYVRAFEQEADTAARLDHPNVVHVVDRGEDQGRHYLVMELLHGRSLADVFARGRAEDRWLPAELAVHVIARAAQGLHYVHQARDEDGSVLGMVHGDVSPQNIFLTRDGEVKVIDFGLAHSALPSGADSPAKMYGKVHYLAPEQCANARIDARADVFALGAVLYEALAANSAFSAASKFLVMLRISQGQHDPIRTHVPKIDPALELIVERALAAEPDQRFSDAEAMRAALDAHLASRAITIDARKLAAYLSNLFGPAVDAAGEAAALPRRSTSRVSEPRWAVRPPQPWGYLAAGLAVGILLGLLWVLHLL